MQGKDWLSKTKRK